MNEFDRIEFGDGIIRIVAQLSHIDHEALVGHDRQDSTITLWRRIGMFLCLKAGMSTTQAGRVFDKDHNAAMRARRAIEKRMASAPAFATQITNLMRDVGIGNARAAA